VEKIRIQPPSQPCTVERHFPLATTIITTMKIAVLSLLIA
jgi:hypothetical protein